MSEFLTFRRFNSLQEAQIIGSLLEEHGIPCEIENAPRLLDSNLIGQDHSNAIALKIPSSSFITADEIIRAKTRIEAPDEDYYLLSFTDAELKEVIEKKDEWGDYDYALALQLLEQRGIHLSAEDIAQLQQKRVTRLANPERAPAVWIFIGYLASFLGAGMGMFIGAFFLLAKRTLPDGKRAQTFTGVTRLHGKIILAFGICMFFTWIVYMINGGTPPGRLGMFWIADFMVNKL
ncbi:hypothetical protein [uncultured Chitinophaga sp.]|uniref:hypothetical protein n=1 Tax=uncultured Chitinophaga sp. TaxID=339340 RepID=UPI0025E1CE03|nr:hypothetical protein [uncultured Chitinophaga sp.]